MKKLKKISILFLLIIVLSMTGCTQRSIDEKSGQVYIENIFCKPTDEKLIEIYDKNKIEIDKLPECESFKVNTGGYEGLWTSVFVKPLSYLILVVGIFVKNYGLAVIIISMLIRAVMIPITKNTSAQSENMKKAKPELQKLEKKYQNKTDQQSMMMKSQEMMTIYKKNNIKPLAGCLFAFLQLPIFIAFMEAIYRMPIFFEEKFLGLQLGTTASQAIGQGDYQYLIVVVLIVASTYISFKNINNSSLDSSQEKQMKIMMMIMMGTMVVASFQLPVAIALYWVTSTIFTIIQNFVIKKQIEKKEV